MKWNGMRSLRETKQKFKSNKLKFLITYDLLRLQQQSRKNEYCIALHCIVDRAMTQTISKENK